MPYAVVTGASTGIGRELARTCAQAGYDLVVVARKREPLDVFAAEVRSLFQRHVLVLPIDLARPEAPSQLYSELSAIQAEIEILINNAGFGLLGNFVDLEAQSQMEMVQLNVGALTHLCRLFAPSMIARGKGYILNVASTAAFQPGPLMAVYYATKAYVLSLSSALHNELEGRGVAVTALCPGPTATEFGKRSGASVAALFTSSNVMTPQAVAEIGFRALMRRKAVVVAGRLNATMAFLTRFAPRQLAAAMARRMQET